MNMKSRLLTFNAAFLFLCVSMYLGTGWSMILFSFPVVPKLTVDNYYLVFVPEVASATSFFTPMTKLMIVSACLMTWGEWPTCYRWIPIVVLLSVLAATALTVYCILPLNQAMTAGIKSQADLQRTLASWTSLNKMRVAFWSVQWGAMMLYFALKSNPPRGGGAQ